METKKKIQFIRMILLSNGVVDLFAAIASSSLCLRLPCPDMPLIPINSRLLLVDGGSPPLLLGLAESGLPINLNSIGLW